LPESLICYTPHYLKFVGTNFAE